MCLSKYVSVNGNSRHSLKAENATTGATDSVLRMWLNGVYCTFASGHALHIVEINLLKVMYAHKASLSSEMSVMWRQMIFIWSLVEARGMYVSCSYIVLKLSSFRLEK